MEDNPGNSTFKTFVCHICGRIFIRNHRLQSHIRTHNKRKLSVTPVVKDQSSSTQGRPEHQATSAAAIETSSAVEQPKLLRNAVDHNTDFDECASTSPATNDSSSSQNRLTEEVGRISTPSLIKDSNFKRDKSQLKENIVSLLVSEEPQSHKSLAESKNGSLDNSSATSTTKLTKIQQYPTGQNSGSENIEVLIQACDIDVMINETDIGKEVETKTTNAFETDIAITTSKSTKRVRVNYVCEFCPRTFSNKAHYERHILTHTKEKPHVCPKCSKRFAQVGNLNAHLRLHCDKEKSNVDEPEPNPEANTGASQKARKSRVRTKETVFYSCEVCNMRFSSRCYLERHALTHTKEKPHICNVCFRGFAQIGNLNVHYRTHTNLKTFVCHVCDKAFTLMGSLKAHLLTHMEQKPFECDICGKGFSSNCFLKRHYLTHTDFKPHVCGVCQRGFVQVGNLNVHLLTHVNQNSFKCNVCDKTFARKLYLERHQKVHANGNGKVATIKIEKVYSKENDIDFSMENNNAQMIMNEHLHDKASVC